MDSRESPTKLIERKIEPSPLSSSSSSSSTLFRGLPAGDAGEGEGSGIPRPLESLHEAPIPPFLSKTYDLVDEPALDALISWGPTGCTFVVWDPPAFAQAVLPRHFKHSNFSSFVRQLNTYGFHKIDTERWEFANEDFLRGKKSLLKKIHRRKSSQVQNLGIHIGSSSETGGPEPEGELHRLRREKNLLMQEVVKLQQEHLMAVQQMDVLNQRMQSVEVRQKQMVSFLAKVLKNPVFLAHLRQQKEQREIASTRARRKFLKHQCSQTESDKYVKQEGVDYQLNFHDSSSSSLMLDIESGVGDHCEDNLLQYMVEKLGLDASKEQILGASDKAVEVTGAAYLDSNAAAFKTKDAMGTQIDCSFDTSEYFTSFSEDITPEGEIRDSLIPVTESPSRSKRDITDFKGELPSRDNNELLQSFAEEISSEEVLPGVVTPAQESIIEEADIWNAGFDDAWDNLVLYDAQELEIGAGSSTPWDVGTSGAEECLDIGKHVSCESSFQKLESHAAVPSEDPKSMEP